MSSWLQVRSQNEDVHARASCCTCAGVLLDGRPKDGDEPVGLEGRLLVEAGLQQGSDSISGHWQMHAFRGSLDNWSHQDLCTAHILVSIL